MACLLRTLLWGHGSPASCLGSRSWLWLGPRNCYVSSVAPLQARTPHPHSWQHQLASPLPLFPGRVGRQTGPNMGLLNTLPGLCLLGGQGPSFTKVSCAQHAACAPTMSVLLGWIQCPVCRRHSSPPSVLTRSAHLSALCADSGDEGRAEPSSAAPAGHPGSIGNSTALRTGIRKGGPELQDEHHIRSL